LESAHSDASNATGDGYAGKFFTAVKSGLPDAGYAVPYGYVCKAGTIAKSACSDAVNTAWDVYACKAGATVKSSISDAGNGGQGYAGKGGTVEKSILRNGCKVIIAGKVKFYVYIGVGVKRCFNTGNIAARNAVQRDIIRASGAIGGFI